jgi:hypothetical protein
VATMRTSRQGQHLLPVNPEHLAQGIDAARRDAPRASFHPEQEAVRNPKQPRGGAEGEPLRCSAQFTEISSRSANPATSRVPSVEARMDPMERLLLDILSGEVEFEEDEDFSTLLRGFKAPPLEVDESAVVTEDEAAASLARFLARPIRWDAELDRYVFTDD